MPELPEVETIARDLKRHLIGITIDEVRIHDPRVIRGIPKKFIEEVKKRKITTIFRRAKAVVIDFTDGFLVIQPKMTGQLIYGEDLKALQNLKETKVTFKLSDGRYLNYNDQRLFGKLCFVKSLEDHPYIQTAGVEPLDTAFSAAWLKNEFKKRRTPVKLLLMKQEFVAGIGNIYASEILFQAGVHPKRQANRVKPVQIEALYEKTVAILTEAIAYRGSSMRNYRDSAGEKGNFMNRIKVYAKEDEPCPVCRTKIKRIVQGARSTFFCPQCQK